MSFLLFLRHWEPLDKILDVTRYVNIDKI